MSDPLALVRRAGVLAVLRAPSADAALAAVDALVRGGVSGIEVTFSTPDAPAVIAAVRERHGDDVLVGAGTVLTAEHARTAIDAGAQFLVSPGTVPALVAAMTATGATTMTGALTPTEVMTAHALGADIVKVFPASLSGPGYLAALRAPLPHIPLMPTGGVTPDNVAAWFAAGAVAVGAGGDLVPGAALAAGDTAEIERRAHLFSDALRAARSAEEAR
ncbi:bifunctional 4-hydroxy-2-oxoglutarate aldolase/2-dehydro-3-deoxy-phosphogluconate aldolase [Microbacterium sp. ABRD28]|uniref:bifunctional 4-hydroxy-2-oxoglutarate aldolase/2-dehydro-3-deoxy-phosphogluconate aldolase n=1 Tax=Microbacterium sp. ABRD28 TaxID=2268461 RepID=UPI000F5548B9|nr:bifunctional 4-hydroxy-2-oxoglutarate aldolase/2-dehydro-3-deoxy-phosphogluconate aldolase [Microbacterium sp. ABRD28]AZC12653.1 bifunctional 4-hydroxy-2-oxoglutarate aldolase/2-dehydro-3-deoxy-phosphogluconate aldolase [Microbacterium sp. ABRD28]